MSLLRDLKEKLTKNLKEQVDIEVDIQKVERAEAERQDVIRRKLEAKRKAQLDHEAYLYERDRQQQLKNEANTPEAKMREAEEQARLNRKRDAKMGLTAKQIENKYKNTKERVREMNREAERETDKMLFFTNRSKFRTNLRKLVE